MSRPWVVVVLFTVGVSALLISGLALVNLVTEYRELARRGVPRPMFVMFHRLSALLPWIRASDVSRLRNRTALLCWDARWVTSGVTLARVVEVFPLVHELELDLAQPIVLFATGIAPEVRLARVRFAPVRAERANYELAEVRGRLSPPLADGLIATAEIVVYPENSETPLRGESAHR